MGGERTSAASAPVSTARRLITSPYLAVAVAMLCFASSTVVVRGVRESVPPLGLSFWRTLLGALIILPFAWPSLSRSWGLIRREIGIIAFLSFLLIIGGNAILFLALQYTIAINVGVLNSFEPVIIIVVAWAIFRDPVSINQVLGIGISLLGVLALIGRGDPMVLVDLDFNFGDILVLGAYLSWSFYAVYLRKAPHGLDPKAVLFVLLFVGAMMLLPLYVVEAVFVRPTVLSLPTIAAICGLALFSSVVAILLWNYSVRTVGAGRSAPFIHLIAAFTIVLAIVFLGETLAWYHILGIALIGIGIYLSTFYRRTVH